MGNLQPKRRALKAGEFLQPVHRGAAPDSRLWLAQQLVLGQKVLAGISHQLTVAGVVHGFDPDDLVDQAVVMHMDVLDELQLGLRRPDDQDLLGALERMRDRVVIRLASPLRPVPTTPLLACRCWCGRAG